jgi:hypothetical protein
MAALLRQGGHRHKCRQNERVKFLHVFPGFKMRLIIKDKESKGQKQISGNKKPCTVREQGFLKVLKLII